jgi:methionyl-tRNA formyltransferase
MEDSDFTLPSVVFMGTPEFAVPSLRILLHHRYPVTAVVTAPDKPRGRGQQVSGTPIKELALHHNLRVLQPETPTDPEFAATVNEVHPDIIVVVAYRILPRAVFEAARLGTFNLHASLLPKYRGAAPIPWAIINGENETGVTTFFLKEKVDTGNIILQARVPIGPDDTAGTVHDRLSELGAEIVLHTVRLIEQGKANPKTQDNTKSTPAPKIFREHCRIDWNQRADQIHNLIRGLSPHPTAFTYHRGIILRVYRSAPGEETALAPPGTVRVEGGSLSVATGDRMLALTELQQEGRKRLGVEEFLRGYRIATGDILGS